MHAVAGVLDGDSQAVLAGKAHGLHHVVSALSGDNHADLVPVSGVETAALFCERPSLLGEENPARQPFGQVKEAWFGWAGNSLEEGLVIRWLVGWDALL